MPVRSLRNQYLGINAHLHSAWQNSGGWDSFHGTHIVHIMTLLKAQLRPLGYTVDFQQSLQLRRSGEPAGRPESDVTIYDPIPQRQGRFTPSATLTMPLPELLDLKEPDVAPYRAVTIYHQDKRGEVVAWLELLSPSNKPGGQDAHYYQDKRLKLLESGIVFVEIDYLHESAPTFATIPNYRAGIPGSHPYRIVVADPRPGVQAGSARMYAFDVDQTIPIVTIPLNAGEVVEFDFGQAYQKTFDEAFYGDQVDYGELPANFERYSEADRSRIVARMLAVLKAYQAGENLDQVPLAVEVTPLADGLAQLKNYV